MTENVCKTCHTLIFTDGDGHWQHLDPSFSRQEEHEPEPDSIAALADQIEQEGTLYRETMDVLWRAVGTLIRLERERRGLYLWQVGELVGVTAAAISYLEASTNHTSLERLRRLGEVLDDK